MNLKNTFIALFVFTCFENSNLHSSQWGWAQTSGGSLNDDSKSIATAIDGSVYITGSFTSPAINFGGIVLNSVMGPSCTFCEDVFLTKYDSMGNVVWSLIAGGNKIDRAYAVATDVFGNVYVTGSFSSDSISFGNYTLFNSTNGAAFIVKYDSNGNVIWARSPVGESIGACIASDSSGNIVCSGTFSGTLAFGNIILNNLRPGYRDVFLVKYDSSGNALWAKKGSGYDFEYVHSIKVDPAENIYLAGQFRSPSITFDNTILNNLDTTQMYDDIFVAKYDPSGNLIWARSAGGEYSDRGISITTDNSANLYLLCTVQSPTVMFGNISAPGLYSMLVKCDSAGNFLWVKNLTGTHVYPGGITVDIDDRIYTTGMMQNSTVTLGNITLTNAGLFDGFVAEFDSSGNAIWADRFGGTNYDIGYSIATSLSLKVYVTGIFRSDTFSIGNFTFQKVFGPYTSDLFIAELTTMPLTIEDNFKNEEVNIFPNPTNNSFWVKASSHWNTIEIFDIIGKLQFENDISISNEIYIDVNFPSGIYLVQLKNGERKVVKKLIVK